MRSSPRNVAALHSSMHRYTCHAPRIYSRKFEEKWYSRSHAHNTACRPILRVGMSRLVVKAGGEEPPSKKQKITTQNGYELDGLQQMPEGEKYIALRKEHVA